MKLYDTVTHKTKILQNNMIKVKLFEDSIQIILISCIFYTGLLI
jgi:hypothetical protein